MFLDGRHLQCLQRRDSWVLKSPEEGHREGKPTGLAQPSLPEIVTSDRINVSLARTRFLTIRDLRGDVKRVVRQADGRTVINVARSKAADELQVPAVGKVVNVNAVSAVDDQDVVGDD